MSLSPELAAAYRESTRPYIDGGGAITEVEANMHPWRVFLEINSQCNLHCITCTKGNKPGYEHLNGIMDWDLMLRCLDKIQSENPRSIVFLYGNSEPFLHPRLPEVIGQVKKRGLRCEFSTNLNHIPGDDDAKKQRRAYEVLQMRPDFIIVSVSGFTQKVYERGHCGGNIDKVKANMKVLSDANAQCMIPVPISLNYHIYDYNEHELPLMREYAASLGLGLFTSLARVISMENAIQICREDDPERTDFEIQKGRPDWNKAFPPVTKEFRDITTHLKIPPQKARDMYTHYPMHSVCPVGAGGLFTFIRHDGLTEMCSCVADRRVVLGNYLDMTPEQMIEKRTGHSICKQCLKYRLSYFFHIVDRKAWASP